MQLQHQLEHSFPASSDDPNDRQRYQATLSLKNSLRERLTTHVMLQQEMLQHLDALVSSEASKPSEDTPDGADATSADAAAAAAAETATAASDAASASDSGASGASSPL